ncbi:MAG: FtsX-like permease family protein [Planctomycetota bacterium]
MIRAFSAFLALRYLLSRWINLLGMFGVLLGVWAMIVVIAVFSGFVSDIRDNTHRATPDLLFAGLKPGTSFAAIDAAIHEDGDVVATAPRLRHHGMYFPHGRRGQWLQTTRGMPQSQLTFDYLELLGVDPERERATTRFDEWLAAIDLETERVTDRKQPFRVQVAEEEARCMQSGDAIGPGPLLSASPGIVLSKRRFESSRLSRAQRIDILTGRFWYGESDADLLAVRRIFAISGVYETKHRIFDETVAMVSIDSLRDLLGLPTDDPFATGPTDVVSDVAIRVRDGVDARAVGARLTARLGERFGGRALDWEQQNSVYLGAVDQERAMMKLVLFAVMLVAASLIYATLHMSVMQKVKDIGILSSMGASPRGVQHLFLLSGLVVGVVGCLLGIVSGIFSAIYLNDLNDWSRRQLHLELFPTDIYALDRVPYLIEPLWVAQVAIAALLIAFIAAWLPARRAARMDPVRALAYE